LQGGYPGADIGITHFADVNNYFVKRPVFYVPAKLLAENDDIFLMLVADNAYHKNSCFHTDECGCHGSTLARRARAVKQKTNGQQQRTIQQYPGRVFKKLVLILPWSEASLAAFTLTILTASAQFLLQRQAVAHETSPKRPPFLGQAPD
jgi:hypothetical protein